MGSMPSAVDACGRIHKFTRAAARPAPGQCACRQGSGSAPAKTSEFAAVSQRVEALRPFPPATRGRLGGAAEAGPFLGAEQPQVIDRPGPCKDRGGSGQLEAAADPFHTSRGRTCVGFGAAGGPRCDWPNHSAATKPACTSNTDPREGRVRRIQNIQGRGRRPCHWSAEAFSPRCGASPRAVSST
jgi:hypothetical protein